MKKQIIIDTDPGHDDALAIMLAVKSDMFDIKAITTVAGNSTIENTTRNARYILNLLEREDIPIYSGAEKQLERELIKAVVHGKSGLEGIDPQNEPRLTNNAIDKIISIIKENPEITIVTLGPLTNIALAIKRNPEIMKKVKEIVIMGGAIKVPGNKNRVAEFNIFVDPEAAETVFNFPIKKIIVPLDACNTIPIKYKEFEQIKNTKIKNPILFMMRPYIENISKFDSGTKAALMYDPLTVYYLINPKAYKLRQYDIKIETKGDLTRGMTVPELRAKERKDYNVKVAEQINAKEFKKDFLAILSRGDKKP